MITTTRVVIPAAVSGLVAAGILAVSRALGETMVVFIAGGGGDGALFTQHPTDSGITMTAAMASIVGGTDQVVGPISPSRACSSSGSSCSSSPWDST